jgi:hypothetical protein
MKTVLWIFVALTIGLTSIGSVANAASAKEVKRVLKAIKNDRKMMLAYKSYGDGSFQSVYVQDGKRYTAYYSGPKTNYLSFWVRPEGTTEQNLIKTFTDHRLSGKVGFGIQGYPDQKTFDTQYRKVGLQHQKYWQSLYDQAIADALNHFYYFED